VVRNVKRTKIGNASQQVHANGFIQSKYKLRESEGDGNSYAWSILILGFSIISMLIYLINDAILKFVRCKV